MVSGFRRNRRVGSKRQPVRSYSKMTGAIEAISSAAGPFSAPASAEAFPSTGARVPRIARRSKWPTDQECLPWLLRMAWDAPCASSASR